MDQMQSHREDSATESAAPAAFAAPAPRFDLYAPIHKALRANLFEVVHAAGRLDPADPVEVSATLVMVDALLDFCQHHLELENTVVHPALESRQPGTTAAVAGEHVGHEIEIARLRRQAAALGRAPAAERAPRAHALYLALAHFAGENLVHMNEEETKHNPALWAAFTDQELMALEAAIKSRLAPAEMAVTLRWMLPALAPAQRALMLRGIREQAPAPAYEGARAIARERLDAKGWKKLEAALAA